jgi:hypothetical protein
MLYLVFAVKAHLCNKNNFVYCVAVCPHYTGLASASLAMCVPAGQHLEQWSQDSPQLLPRWLLASSAGVGVVAHPVAVDSVDLPKGSMQWLDSAPIDSADLAQHPLQEPPGLNHSVVSLLYCPAET